QQIGIGMNGQIRRRRDECLRSRAQLWQMTGGAVQFSEQGFTAPDLRITQVAAGGNRKRLQVERDVRQAAGKDLRAECVAGAAALTATLARGRKFKALL